MSGLTPGRTTRAVFDYDTTLQVRRAWGGERRFSLVSPRAAQDKSGKSAWTANIHYWATGAWTLKPIQLTDGEFVEKALPQTAVYLPSSDGGTGATQLLTNGTTVVSTYKPEDTSTGTVAAGGDKFLKIVRPAGSDWPDTVTALQDAKVTALKTRIGADFSVTSPLYEVARTNLEQRANQGYCLRFYLFGANITARTVLGCFVFGQYALVLGGDGKATLYERGRPDTGSPYVWEYRYQFAFARPNAVNNHYHKIVIYPHLGLHGEKYICFASLALDAIQAGSSSGATPAGNAGGATTEYKYLRDPSQTGLLDESGDNVTSSGHWWLLQRRAMQANWQVSRLVFPTTGTLKSLPWTAESEDDTRAITTLKFLTGPTTSPCTVTETVYDYRSGATTGVVHPRVDFAFASDGLDSTVLWGFSVSRAATFAAFVPGSMTTSLRSLRISGGDNDPRRETAQVEIEDLTDSFSRLRNRAELPVKFVTNVPSGSTTKDVVLFQGTLISPHRVRKGKPGKRAGFAGAGEEVVYPSPEWSGYSGACVGLWQRLTEINTRAFLAWSNFLIRDAGLLQWKVTDAIKALLTAAGFPASMQRIPDLPIRFMPGIGSTPTDQIKDPSPDIGSMIIRLCRDYLGRFLVFDPNDGTLGKWTLIGAPPPSSAPLLNFVGGMTPDEGEMVVPTLAAYGSVTASGTSVPNVPILDRRESFFIAPEANHLWCVCPMGSDGATNVKVDNHLYNHLSYPVPGSTATLDPSSPHFLGREKLLIVADPTLWAGAKQDTYQKTQQFLDYVMMRYFVVACLPREIRPVRAPLALVTDPVHGGLRPPRFYDPVLVDGQPGWYVRSCSPDIANSRFQYANFELERVVPYLV